MGCILVEKTLIQNQHKHDTELHTDIYYCGNLAFY